MSKADFRPYLPTPEQSKISGPTARAHTKARQSIDRVQSLFSMWGKLFAEPFRGITTDGALLKDLFTLRPERAPNEAIVVAANALLATMTDDQRTRAVFPVDSEQWRNWQNTEMYVETHGLRLEEISERQRDAVMAVLRASLSDQGYEATRNVMRLNRFLGDLVGGPQVMNEWSYTFCIFGAPSTTEPSTTEPWGWQLFGHHLCLNCLVIGTQMVVTPAFFGAEPAYVDSGPHKGLSLFDDEERAGLSLMTSLTRAQQERAIVYHSMMGGDLPEGRRHFADNLHLGGAYQDNRVVPYEGLPGAELTAEQRRRLTDLTAAYLAYLPDGPRAARLEDFERHFDATHFCWIGGTGEADPFYYRIQSPVVFIEFDHHAGVFLTNETPQRFHIHTIVRTPNGNDYGIDLLRQHYAQAHGPHSHG